MNSDDNDFNPKVSIVIPVCNGSDYLRSAIESALNQTYKNIEVIVVNDGSNDEGKTEAIANSYGQRIRYLYKENGGVASALNVGIRNMAGEYFSWLSHDDVYYPNKLEEQINYLQIMNRNDIIIYSDYELIDKNSTLIRDVRLKKIDPRKMPAALLKKSFINGCTLLIPSICFDNEMPFKENLKSTQDYDLWFRLSLSYDFVHLNRILIRSRQHSKQASRTLRKSHKKECNEFFISSMKRLERQKNEYFINDSKSRYFAILSYSLLIRGFFNAMMMAFLVVIKNLSSEAVNRAGKMIRKVFEG